MTPNTEMASDANPYESPLETGRSLSGEHPPYPLKWTLLRWLTAAALSVLGLFYLAMLAIMVAAANHEVASRGYLPWPITMLLFFTLTVASSCGAAAFLWILKCDRGALGLSTVAMLPLVFIGIYWAI